MPTWWHANRKYPTIRMTAKAEDKELQSTPAEDLVISTFPPKPCGIGAYAAQFVLARKQEGRQVQIMSLSSPVKGAESLTIDMQGRTDWKRLWSFARKGRFGEVTLQYSGDFFRIGGQSRRSRKNHFRFLVLIWILWWRAQKLVLVIHEFSRATDDTWRQRLFDAALFLSAKQLVFHTDQQRDEFLSEHALVSQRRAVIRVHEQFFTRHFLGDRAQARRMLGLSPEAHLFLCIGFLQPNKGFDAAMAGFEKIDPDILHSFHAELHVVGDCRTTEHQAAMYKRTLQNQTKAANAPLKLHAGFVSDEAFDCWLCAADHVILPYRQIWSSGVAARAVLFATPLIARRLPELQAQLAERQSTTWFDDDDEIASVLTAVLTSGDTE